MVDGAVVGTVVDGFGEVEVGVGPVVVEGTDVGGFNDNFSDAAIDSMPFSKVAPKRCSKVCRSDVDRFVGWV